MNPLKSRYFHIHLYFHQIVFCLHSNWIEELLKDRTKIKLFTRPRRFGKTLNMSTLKYFFDVKNAEENKKFNLLTEELENANDRNTKIEEDKHQYFLAVDCLKGKSDSQFYLSEYLLKIFEENLNELIDDTIKKGIFLTPDKLDLDIMGLGTEQACIYMISKNLKTIKELCGKIKNA